MTRREKISRTILGYLQGISVTGGYRTNIGSYVSLCGTKIVPHEEVYDVNLIDVENFHQLGHTETLSYRIELHCEVSNNYSIMCNMISDVVKALYDNQENLKQVIGDSGIRIIPGSEKIELIRDKDKERGFGTVEFIVEHRITEKWEFDNNNY